MSRKRSLSQNPGDSNIHGLRSWISSTYICQRIIQQMLWISSMGTCGSSAFVHISTAALKTASHEAM